MFDIIQTYRTTVRNVCLVFERGDRTLSSCVKNMRREIIARRKRQQRVKGIATVSALILSILIVFCVFGVDTNARSIDDHPEYKYFTNYELEYGDTLWSIAETYADHHYDSIEDYIREVCTINSITEDSYLICGTSLIIPYYSQEFMP